MSSLISVIAGSRRRFNPISLSPALWLSDTGSDPSIWEDISGNGRNATQATAADQPDIITNAQNGRQVRRFNDTTDNLLTPSFSLSQPFTTYAVYKAPTTTLNKLVLRNNDSSGSAIPTVHRSAVGNTSGLNFGTGFFPLVTIADWQILCTIANGSSSVVQRNGGSDNTGNAGNTNVSSGFIVGNLAALNSALNGDIAEILIFPTALSTEERRKVEIYLSNKWGIALT